MSAFHVCVRWCKFWPWKKGKICNYAMQWNSVFLSPHRPLVVIEWYCKSGWKTPAGNVWIEQFCWQIGLLQLANFCPFHFSMEWVWRYLCYVSFTGSKSTSFTSCDRTSGLARVREKWPTERFSECTFNCNPFSQQLASFFVADVGNCSDFKWSSLRDCSCWLIFVLFFY